MKNILCALMFLSLALGLLCNGCGYIHNPDAVTTEKHASFSPDYRIKNIPITSIATDWSSIKLNINHVDEQLSVLCEYGYTDNMFRIIDLSKDEVVNIVKLPAEIKKIGSISISDTNAFAFLTDTTFYIYKDNSLKRIDYAIFNDDYIPLSYINIIYKAKENKLISGVLTYKQTKRDELSYSSYFLNVYDLNTMTSSRIPFSYPEQFHGNKLGVPRVHLSEWDNNLIVSFELDDNIYKIDLNTNVIDTILCKSSISSIQEAFFPVNGSKQSKVDAIHANLLHVGGYGPAYFNKKMNKIYRVYRPELPIKDNDGNYFSSKDRGAHIIELDVTNNKKKEVQLANGQYCVPYHWSYNPFTNSLTYPKLEEHVAKKNLCFYNIHHISIYNK